MASLAMRVALVSPVLVFGLTGGDVCFANAMSDASNAVIQGETGTWSFLFTGEWLQQLLQSPTGAIELIVDIAVIVIWAFDKNDKGEAHTAKYSFWWWYLGVLRLTVLFLLFCLLGSCIDAQRLMTVAGIICALAVKAYSIKQYLKKLWEKVARL